MLFYTLYNLVFYVCSFFVVVAGFTVEWMKKRVEVDFFVCCSVFVHNIKYKTPGVWSINLQLWVYFFFFLKLQYSIHLLVNIFMIDFYYQSTCCTFIDLGILKKKKIIKILVIKVQILLLIEIPWVWIFLSWQLEFPFDFLIWSSKFTVLVELWILILITRANLVFMIEILILWPESWSFGLNHVLWI